MAVYGNYKYITEFQGNPEKNKEFIEILNGFKKICEIIKHGSKKLIDILNRLLPSLKSINNNSKLTKLMNESEKWADDWNDWKQKELKGLSPHDLQQDYKRKVKNFNNKYSEIIMEEKKKINNELDKFEKELDTMVSPWSADPKTRTCKKMEDIREELRRISSTINEQYAERLYSKIKEVYNAAIDEIEWGYNSINLTKKALNIEAENKVLYKVVNKLLK